MVVSTRLSGAPLSCVVQVSKQCVPLFVGLTVLAIGISFGYNCGYAINPARDLAPRLFTLVSGWGGYTYTVAV